MGFSSLPSFQRFVYIPYKDVGDGIKISKLINMKNVCRICFVLFFYIKILRKHGSIHKFIHEGNLLEKKALAKFSTDKCRRLKNY